MKGAVEYGSIRVPLHCRPDLHNSRRRSYAFARGSVVQRGRWALGFNTVPQL